MAFKIDQIYPDVHLGSIIWANSNNNLFVFICAKSIDSPVSVLLLEVLLTKMFLGHFHPQVSACSTSYFQSPKWPNSVGSKKRSVRPRPRGDDEMMKCYFLGYIYSTDWVRFHIINKNIKKKFNLELPQHKVTFVCFPY